MTALDAGDAGYATACPAEAIKLHRKDGEQEFIPKKDLFRMSGIHLPAMPGGIVTRRFL